MRSIGIDGALAAFCAQIGWEPDGELCTSSEQGRPLSSKFLRLANGQLVFIGGGVSLTMTGKLRGKVRTEIAILSSLRGGFDLIPLLKCESVHVPVAALR